MFIPPVDTEWIMREGGPLMGMITGQGWDRTPVNPYISGHAATLHGRPISEYYQDPKLGCEMLVNANRFYQAAPANMWIYIVYWCEDYGGKIRMPTGRMSAPAIIEHPATTIAEAEKIEVLGPEDLSKGPTMKRHWEALDTLQHLMGPAFMPYQFLSELFVVASYWVGPENLLMWVYTDPGLVHKLMRKVTEHSVHANEIVAKRYGGNQIITGSLLAGSSTMSPDQCQKFNVNYMKEMVQRSIKGGSGPALYHLCGDHGKDFQLHDELPFPQGSIIQVGYDGLESMDLTKVAEVFENKCTILGNFDTGLMQSGSPQEIYEESKKQVLAYKNFKKGFIAGMACECPPYAPPANVQAFVRAVKEHGKV